jgi:hypothetical protein
MPGGGAMLHCGLTGRAVGAFLRIMDCGRRWLMG